VPGVETHPVASSSLKTLDDFIYVSPGFGRIESVASRTSYFFIGRESIGISDGDGDGESRQSQDFRFRDPPRSPKTQITRFSIRVFKQIKDSLAGPRRPPAAAGDSMKWPEATYPMSHTKRINQYVGYIHTY
jgi:hypothetical protein